MKKIVFAGGLLLMVFLMGGCLETTWIDVLETEENMDAVAEYAAGLLLKYSPNYYAMLLTEEEMVKAQITPEPTTAPTPTTGAAGRPSGSLTSDGTLSRPTEVGIDSGKLTSLVGVDDFTVSYDRFETKKSYQSTSLFSLDAKEGRQYLFVYFTLTNNTGSEKVFDASEQKLEYLVEVNRKETERASISFMENDMQYMGIPVPADGKASAVVVFEIADVNIETVYLRIRNQTNQAELIKLK